MFAKSIKLTRCGFCVLFTKCECVCVTCPFCFLFPSRFFLRQFASTGTELLCRVGEGRLVCSGILSPFVIFSRFFRCSYTTNEGKWNSIFIVNIRDKPFAAILLPPVSFFSFSQIRLERSFSILIVSCWKFGVCCPTERGSLRR